MARWSLSGIRCTLIARTPIRRSTSTWSMVTLGMPGCSAYGQVGDRPLPALVYRHHEHLITVVAEPQAGDTAPVTVAVDLSAGGFSLVHWTDGAFSYWAISDTERPELDDFVVRFRAAVR